MFPEEKPKATIVVNVASNCGLTNTHYTQLEQLYKQYHSQGLEIIGFPCN
jgi:glutathione peroxidase